MKQPTITLRYSSIYDRMLHRVSQIKAEDADYFVKRKKECIDTIDKINPEIQQVIPLILEKISETIGIPWKINEIIVYILPDFHKNIKSTGFSDPLTIVLNKYENEKSTKSSTDFLIYTLTHELCHVIQRPLSKTKYYEDLAEKGYTNLIVRNHILTFALLKKVLGETKYYEMTKFHNSSPAYKHALEFVEKIGTTEIITEAQKYVINRNI